MLGIREYAAELAGTALLLRVGLSAVCANFSVPPSCFLQAWVSVSPPSSRTSTRASRAWRALTTRWVFNLINFAGWTAAAVLLKVKRTEVAAWLATGVTVSTLGFYLVDIGYLARTREGI